MYIKNTVLYLEVKGTDKVTYFKLLNYLLKLCVK